ncbi:MAG: TadE/TadG family type IV pilus assembly protein [Mesorhizobium sp.]
MTQTTKRHSILRRLGDQLRHLRDNRRGVAAIEFALIAPLLLCMYFVTMEVAPAIDTSKKVGRSASMVADLITQQREIKKADLDAIMQIGNATLIPYSRSKLKVTVTAIRISAAPATATVAWSRRMDDGVFSRPFNVGASVTVPTALLLPDTFLIRVTSELGYTPMIAWSEDSKRPLGLVASFSKLNMSKTNHLRPRLGTTITCTDC